MPATMKDIARLTGLSLATISKYLNGGHVLPANQRAIEQAINQLGYTVNSVARSLKTRRSMTIGVLIPHLENVFSTSIISELEDKLHQVGYSTIICDYHHDPEMEAEKLDFLAHRQIDGLVMMPLSGCRDALVKLRERQIPVVLIDRPVEGLDCDAVLVKNRKASFQAVSRLAEAGHERIAIICGPQGVYTADERLYGYMDALKHYQIKLDEDLVQYGNYDTKSGYVLTARLLDRQKPPTAVFVTNHEMTYGSVLAVNERDLLMPKQLSLIGFDHKLLNQVLRPPLAVVTQPLKQIGQTVAELLVHRLTGINRQEPAIIKYLDAVWHDGGSYGPLS